MLRGVPDDGLEITLEADGAKPIALGLLDLASGLPPAETAPIARAVESARAADPRAVQTQEGDVTIVAARLEL